MEHERPDSDRRCAAPKGGAMGNMMTSSVTRAMCCAGLVFAASCHQVAQTSVSSAAAPAGTVIVSNMNDNTVMLLDARTRALLATLPTGRAPHEVATSHDGH